MINTAVILAGGKSTRYGSPKGLEKVGGVTLVNRTVDEIRAAGISDIYLSTDEPELYADIGLPSVCDKYPGCGPLAGIHGTLVETGAEKILVLPCDLPGISSVEIKKLVQIAIDAPEPVVFAVTGTHEHPLCSVVSRELVGTLEKALNDGHHAALRFFKSIDHGTVHFENEKRFHNLNTPEDLKKWEENNVL